MLTMPTQWTTIATAWSTRIGNYTERQWCVWSATVGHRCAAIKRAHAELLELANAIEALPDCSTMEDLIALVRCRRKDKELRVQLNEIARSIGHIPPESIPDDVNKAYRDIVRELYQDSKYDWRNARLGEDWFNF